MVNHGRKRLAGEAAGPGAAESALQQADGVAIHIGVQALGPNRTDRKHFGYYNQDRLEETSLPMLLKPSDRFLYLLLYGTWDRNHSQTILRELDAIMGRLQFSCGVSRSFDGLEHIGRFRRQTEIALETRRRWQSETGVYYYRDLALRTMIDAAAEKLGLEDRDTRLHLALSFMIELSDWEKNNRVG